MKSNYNVKMLLLLMAVWFGQHASATDLVVNAGGAGGTYASLKAAVLAASANDRIIVYPQQNGASYSEGTITINKSLQILSANEGAFYTIDGDINITPPTAGMSVTIIGMKLITGSIQATAAAPTGARCAVNILNDSLLGGGLGFSFDNYNLTAASNYMVGPIAFRFGKVVGNYITGSGGGGMVVVSTDASVNNPTDSVMIVGNKIFWYSSASAGAISWSSTSQFFCIQNNFINHTYGGDAINYGIYISNSKNNSVAGTNSVVNNTVYKAAGRILYGYTIATNANANIDFMNNLVVSTIYYNAFAFSGGVFNAHYNYATNFNWTGVTNDGTNQTATSTTLNAEGLVSNPLSNTINGGTPDSAYADINLTRNDAGCYGGSFTLDNFFPITASDWARVFMVIAPRRVMVNGAINVKASGFDK